MPRPRRRPAPSPVGQQLYQWNVLSIPPLLFAILGQLTPGNLLLLGAVGCVLGKRWRSTCPGAGKWVRDGPMIVSFVAMILGILACFVPTGLLLFVAVAHIGYHHFAPLIRDLSRLQHSPSRGRRR